jgi:hypothetical protein
LADTLSDLRNSGDHRVVHAFLALGPANKKVGFRPLQRLTI